MPTVNEIALNGLSPSSRSARADAAPNELTQLKRDLLRAEVSLAKARAQAAGAEADVKLLTARLKAFGK
jgi:hypothetical protein